MMKKNLKTHLLEEKKAKLKGGLYHKTQLNLAYNSNKIEGSKLSEEQTRYIFETRTIGFKYDEAVSVDDIIETSNHFVAFDYLLDSIEEPLSNVLIQNFHRILKNGTSDATKDWFNVGNWKKFLNKVDGNQTTFPQDVELKMNELNEVYDSNSTIIFEDIVEYHFFFDVIHPFQYGNGSVGRLIMFRECLKKNITPFIIDEEHKQSYFYGLNEFQNIREYLLGTCFSAQETYKQWISHFYGE